MDCGCGGSRLCTFSARGAREVDAGCPQGCPQGQRSSKRRFFLNGGARERPFLALFPPVHRPYWQHRLGVLRIAVYCRRCMVFVRHGRRKGSGVEWIEKCPRCLEREGKDRRELERLEALWAARRCAADDCSVVFTPAAPKQRF